MSDNPESTSPEEPVSPWARGGAGTATLPPGGDWVMPPADGGWGAGTPTWGTPAPPPPPPPPAPRRTWSGWQIALAILVVFALGALAAGPLRIRGNSGSTNTSPSIDLTGPASPFQRGTAGTTPDTSGSSNTTGSGSTLSSSDVTSIAAKVDKAVVDIDTVLGFENGQAAGTGMILTSNGEVLTNNHVIQGSTKITVTVVDTGKTYSAHVVGTDPTDDVAVIQLEGASGLKTITASKSNVSVGDPVVASGNAGGKGGAPSVSGGQVTALNQTITASDDNGANAHTLSNLIEFDASIAPGDSGGPLANKDGEVIGMDSAAEVNSRFRNASSTAGYAIPISRALDIANQIVAGKASSTVHIGLPAFLGVSLAGSTNGRISGRSTGGALLSGVQSGLPADSIGLAAGDTITSVDGQTVDSAAALGPLLTAHRPGEQVTIGWTDSSGNHHSATTTLVAGPAD